MLTAGTEKLKNWNLYSKIREHKSILKRAALKGYHMTEAERLVGNAKIKIINVSSVLQIVF